MESQVQPKGLVFATCDLVLLNAIISLLILCLEDLFIVDSGVFKSPMMSVFLSIPFLKSSKIFLIYFSATMLGSYMFIRLIYLIGYSCKCSVVPFFVSFYGHCFEIYFCLI